MKFIIKNGVLQKVTDPSLQEAIIPKGVTRIGAEAFRDCKSLKHVILPDGLTQIEHSAFESCIALEKIQIPNTVKKIGGGTFRQCKALQNITVPEGVRSICYETFYLCYQLKEVQLPETLVRIGEGAFLSCKNLECLTIPDHVQKVGKQAFDYCERLHEIHYRGIVIRPDTSAYRETNIENLIQIITDRKFHASIRRSAKYDILFQLFFQRPEDEELKAYIKENFINMFPVLIDAEDVVSVQRLLDIGGFVTSRNINKFIRHAIDSRKFQCQILLTNYKSTHIGYREPSFRL